MEGTGAVAVVLAAGGGERLGHAIPKAFVELGGRPMLLHAVSNALRSKGIDAVVAVVPPGWEDGALHLLEPLGVRDVVAGGDTRKASVRAGLAAPTVTAANVIVCHDAARPLAPPSLFEAVLEGLEGAEGVVPVMPIADTVKRLRDGFVERTEPRDALATAQTPQAFDAAALIASHDRSDREGHEVTDDAAALEAAGYRVRAIEGDVAAFKITTPSDLARAARDVEDLLHG
jgi:2-C-methyl-D-erythritol 4-phosphate cytidylyltransferase